jgi:cobalt-precorrin 5A hydrolase
MRWGIITLTRGGLKLAEDIKSKLQDAVIHCPWKLNYPEGAVIEGRFEDYVSTVFNKFDIIIFIMAAGIVVRSIARCITDKTTDPGIIVMDEKGRFVISLLSGHIGGANEAAIKVADLTGAVPVITTASDVNGLISADMLAKELNCKIDSMESAKEITSMIVNNEKVAVVSDHKFKIPEYFSGDPDEADGIIYITNKNNFIKFNKPFVRLIPGNIIAGVGCRKNTDTGDMIEFIESKLDGLGLDKRSIKSLCSIEIKKNEKAIAETAKHFNAGLRFFSSAEIKKVEQKFELSDFVEEQTGAGAVSAPCAYLGSNGSGRMILQKHKQNGITLSLWEEAS